MASSLEGTASNLEAMASKLEAMAPKLEAMASQSRWFLLMELQEFFAALKGPAKASGPDGLQ